MGAKERTGAREGYARGVYPSRACSFFLVVWLIGLVFLLIYIEN